MELLGFSESGLCLRTGVRESTERKRERDGEREETERPVKQKRERKANREKR